MFSLFFYFIILYFDWIHAYLSNNQYQALYCLYNTTNGVDWTWKEPYSSYGYPWNFTDSFYSNPCSLEYPWQGVICSTPCNSSIPCNILSLSLNEMDLLGSLPPNISEFSSLYLLSLSSNLLYGSLPLELYSLVHLQHLYVDQNQLTGSLPTEIGQLSQLIDLDLGENMFTGVIPPSFGQLTQLIYLYAYDNQFHQLPDTIGQLTKIHYFIFDYNELIGTLPSSIGSFTSIIVFDVNTNYLYGTIPSSIGNLTTITNLFLDYNQFTQTIPSTIVQFTSILLLNLHYNLLTGIIPYEICSLITLQVFNIRSNQMSGTIPSCLSQLSTLQLLGLNENYLTQTIPSSLSFPGLIDLELSNNYLSGMFSASILTIAQNNLSFMSISSNMLTGVLPYNLFALSQLIYIDCSYNRFTSSLPIQITNNHTINKLKFLDLSSNQMIGSIPMSLTNTWNQLTYISLVNNSFTGSLPSFGNNHVLRIAYLQNNSFSGTIPEELITIGSWIIFMVSLNCLSGTISTSFCQNSQLIQLTLDGMHSSSSCIHPIFDFTQASSYGLYHGMTGTIPSCLFALPNLQVLHLSGNNLHGSISYPNQTISTTNFPKLASKSNLTTLILSNNLLTGIIPQEIISSSSLHYLDVSFNLFSGFQSFSPIHLINTSNISSNTQQGIRLQVNHFSGQLSNTLIHNLSSYTQNQLNILDGNMFQCNIDRSDLPKQDPHYDSYQCGSDNTNISMYIWSSFLICIFLYTTIYYQHCFWIQSILKKLWSLGGENLDLLHLLKTTIDYQHLTQVAYGYDLLGNTIIFVTIWLFGIILPTYILLSHYYGTYQHQYIWILSSAYLSGIIPAIVLLLLLLIIILYFSYILLRKRNIFDLQFLKLQSTQQLQYFSWIHNIKLLIITIGNMFIVLLVNISYVLAINYGYDNTILTFISLTISIFKLLWGSIMLSGIGRLYIEEYFLHRKINTSLILLLSIFNNVVAPYFAETFASSNCFLYTIINPPTVTTEYYKITCETLTTCLLETSFVCYYYIQCNVFTSINDANKLLMSYLPPFHYNYTCSSSLLSSFAYVFIYRYIYSCLLLSIYIFFMKYIQIHYVMIYDQWKKTIHTCSYGKILSSQALFEFVTHQLPDLLKYEDSFSHLTMFSSNVQQTHDQSMNNQSINEQQAMENQQTQHIDQLKTLEWTQNALNNRVSLGEKSIVRLVTEITMFLSFGVMFPPLGLLILLNLLKEIYIEQWALKRYYQHYLTILSFNNDLSENISEKEHHDKSYLLIFKKLQDILQLINEQFMIWPQLFWVGLWWSSLVAVCFWSFTLFDILGSKVGPIQAIWIVIVMTSSPYWSLGILQCCVIVSNYILLTIDWIFLVNNLSKNQRNDLSSHHNHNHNNTDHNLSFNEQESMNIELTQVTNNPITNL